MPKNKLTFSENKIISLQTASTSKGNQPKWYDKHSDCYIKAQFYYQEKYWRDDLVEMMECKPFHHDNSKVIDYIKTRYHLENYLPEKLDFRGCAFPSGKATSYFLNRCRYLGIAAEGVDY